MKYLIKKKKKELIFDKKKLEKTTLEKNYLMKGGWRLDLKIFVH